MRNGYVIPGTENCIDISGEEQELKYSTVGTALTIREWKIECDVLKEKYKSPGVRAEITYKLFPTGTEMLVYTISLWEASDSQTFDSVSPENALMQMDSYMANKLKNNCPACGQKIQSK